MISRRRHFLQQSVLLLGLALIACESSDDHVIAPQLQNVGVTMTLESSAFMASGSIPVKYTCDGQDLSPPLTWSQPPENTQSLVLIVDDPDAPVGTFVHWVLYNLPSETRQLPEAVSTQAQQSDGGLQGKNGFGNLGYGGPCPPSGTHRYFFKLYALDRGLDLTSGSTKKQVLKAMNGHILAAGELMGTYTRRSQ